MFMIDLKLLVCLEANDPTDCIVNVDVFKNLKIRKKECNWNIGFKVKGTNCLKLTKGVCQVRACFGHKI